MPPGSGKAALHYVLDASAFFSDIRWDGGLLTTPSVESELLDIRARGRFEDLSARGLAVIPPTPESLRRVEQAAKTTRDAAVLSSTDRDVLALALDAGAAVCTDDFALQNVALELGVAIQPIRQRRAKKVAWKYRCSGCGRYSATDGECPVCGAEIKRKLK